MTLVHWSPLSTLLTGPSYPTASVRRWVPPMDLVEAPEHYLVRLDLPGLGRDDVTIEIEDRVLTISGERTATVSGENARAVRVERAGGGFRRSLTLPDGIDADAVTAHMEHGVLTVSVPKPVAAKPRRVEISAGAAA
ncbi:Hsp20/alpha crystallin family protein [Paraconexibacter algicola]|uniref:Heat-shock protein n=1 Tax=Paraconexibacter algicola TaxID=2133960 RepID=A0A2T4UDX8_9ACTN|nr:Hsp20/alpha crystallin family protein [Paraconexibacter algicola]PTL55714.1 heat-shock protein [Paraconexibacter algicola]